MAPFYALNNIRLKNPLIQNTYLLFVTLLNMLQDGVQLKYPQTYVL